MAETEVPVLCNWKSYMKDGVYYAGPSPKVIKVEQNTKFDLFLDQLFLLTGLDKQRSKFDIICSYPSPFPVVDDISLKTMLDISSNHRCIEVVEVYMEVKSGEVIDLVACSSKRKRTKIDVKVECESSEVEVDAEIGKGIDSDMAELDVPVLCYWNTHFKCGCDAVHYEGSTSKLIKVKPKTKLSTLMDEIYLLTGLDIDTERSKIKIYGSYPSVDPQSVVTHLLIPVMDDATLETILEVPRKHSCIGIVELYLEVKSDEVISPAPCSSPLASPGSSSKRQKTQHLSPHEEANSFVDTNMTNSAYNLEKDNGLKVQGVDENNECIEDEPNEDIVYGDGCGDDDGDNGNVHKDLKGPGLEALLNACLNKGDDSSASRQQFLPKLWIDDHELRVGLCFNDRDELKKAVDWCCIRGRQKYVVQENGKDEYKFECIRWKCKWSLCAARIEENGLVEITKCSGPHTCCPIVPAKFDVVFATEEIESLIRVQPTLTVSELKAWWFEKFSYKLGTVEMQTAKQEAIKKVYGDWDQSFRLLPKLMAALHSSNGLLVDWQYDVFPNTEFASFRGVFWAFSQSVKGFQHCIPLIVVDAKNFSNGEYQLNLMIASGVDTAGSYFPLAFAVSKEVSSDHWRWFLTGIREKVTQRKGICLISSPHPSILAVINEPGSRWQEPWAYHRLCLNHLSSKFHDVFKNCHLKSLVEQAGWSKHLDEFDHHMETIKNENPEARRWLDQMHPHLWSLAHDSGRRYGHMTIKPDNLFSICESFWSPDLPVTAAILLLFDELRIYFQEGLCESRGRLKRGDMYTKPVMDNLEKFKTASVTYIVMPLDDNTFQVTKPLQKDKWTVQLNDSTCTCGKFQRKKFPCLHALAVCEKLRINPLQYVDNCHSVESFYKTYIATFSPVLEVSAWPEDSGVPTLFPPVIPPPPPPTNVSGNSQCKTTPTNVSGNSQCKTTPRTVQKKKS